MRFSRMLQPVVGVISIVCILSLLLRFIYTHTAGLPFADPWRHMTLVRNIRNGLGFTLFDGQPYIWYSPLWYYLVASVAEPENIKWVSTIIGGFTAPLFSLFLFRYTKGSLTAAIVGGLLMAGFGPVIVYSCQLGAEAFAMFLFVCALFIGSYQDKKLSSFFSGILFGLSVAARLQFSLAMFVFFSVVTNKIGRFFFIIGTSVPLLIHWIRNSIVINKYNFIFTWDGMATHRSEYNLISTLAVQLHPSVVKANRMLYEIIVPLPQWLFSDDRFRWEFIFFFVISFTCVLFSRNFFLFLSVCITVFYFLFFDETLSAHFLRNWIGLFPLLFIGCAVYLSSLSHKSVVFRRIYIPFLVAALLFCGIFELIPRMRIPPLEAVNPPEELLQDDYFMVNSGLYNPESLCYRYPSKSFIGMPFSPERFDEFQNHYPAYRLIVWRESFNIQHDLYEFLVNSGQYVEVSRKKNVYGLEYLLLKLIEPELM
jgi:hypothetical protein